MGLEIRGGRGGAVISYVSPMYMEIKTVKTYLWIKATAISSKTNINKIVDNLLNILIVPAHKDMRIWPAVMFAANRTDRVIGRIICLTLSITIINWDRGRGVLKGTRWLKKWLVLLVEPNKIKPNQKGRANERVNIICAVKVKI